ncbi:MAG: thioesterase [Oscillospiraceae bacterium]|nr:thioesterase [Oscillospiraceae bacterium]
MKEILKNTYPITASDVDCHEQCRLSALLGYLQNMATEHAIMLGLDGAGMIAEHNAVWMIARLHLTLDRPIQYPDEITMHTWHRGVGKGPIIFRDFDILVDDERIGEATMSWILADVQDRKIIKPGTIPALVNTQRPAVVKEIVPEKIKAPAEMVQGMVRPVRYSDTDINGHMNNTKYADVACDVIHYEKMSGKFISEVQINYLHECWPGDELLILRGEQDGTHYVRGTDADGKVRFEVSMQLADCKR